MLLSNNLKRQRILNPIPFMMGLHSQLGYLITDIFQLEPSRMLYADMQVKQDTMSPEGSVGIAMDYL